VKSSETFPGEVKKSKKKESDGEVKEPKEKKRVLKSEIIIKPRVPVFSENRKQQSGPPGGEKGS